MVNELDKVTEEEKEEIKSSTKKLLDEFLSKLEKIEASEVKPDDAENLRQEGKCSEPDEEFQKLMFDNAPLVENNLIVAERGAWKK